MQQKNAKQTTVLATWLAISATILLGQRASAAEPTSPEAYCWEQQAAFIDEGVEMPTGPIEIGGERWHLVWENGSEDSIPGDQISVPFADGVVQISGHTAAMANHLLTLHNHWAAGREPFAVRYDGTLFLIVPYWDNESQEAWCESVPLQS